MNSSPCIFVLFVSGFLSASIRGYNMHTVLACKAVQTAFQTQPGFSLVRERINGMREAGIGEAKKVGRAGGVGR
jgi:hypothetical protein